MLSITQLNELDYEKLSSEITELSKSKAEDELFEIIGSALEKMGLTISNEKSFKIVTPFMYDEHSENFNLEKSVQFALKSEPTSLKLLNNKGLNFWNRFTEKLKSTICNDSKIRELLTGNGTLKDYLIAGIPLVLAALGVGALNPLWLAIIGSVFALIIKAGFKAYCGID